MHSCANRLNPYEYGPHVRKFTMEKKNLNTELRCE